MLSRDVTCPPERVLVTTGSQQAFDILVRIFMDAGDVAYVETPAYPATLQALKLAKARTVQVPVDATARTSTGWRQCCVKARRRTVRSFSIRCAWLFLAEGAIVASRPLDVRKD
ncbi:hypothetical protein RM96_31830 [Cupriavidus sp. IDO]|nr:aminotransferase class I/II-fold pyridoxal phosphate-dependent enzyme [Cupriavidus sp. IDO]KWR77231.1 hypothetical protein RM96_31830 [Cupriavidus sp. IDO]